MNQKETATHFEREAQNEAPNEVLEMAESAARKARKVLEESGIGEIWRKAGCRVNIVGSLRMGLLASHRDIDLHVYSKGITEESSFAIASEIAKNPAVTEIKCINGLHTDEHCVAWHIYYRHEGEIWQFDVIHIEEGTEYDGFFERMADRIVEVMTPQQRETILRLKFATPADADYHGVEYYEAVICDSDTDLPTLAAWITSHRRQPPRYWVP